MGNVQLLNAPAFDPYLPICLFFETVAWFREIFMSHALSHRLTSILINTSTSASLVHIHPIFSVLWCFLSRLHQCKLKPVCRLFFCSSFHSNLPTTAHGSILVKNAAWFEKLRSSKLNSHRPIRCTLRGIDGVKRLIEVITSIQKTWMTSSAKLRRTLFLHFNIISPRDGDYGLGLYCHRQHRLLLRYRSKNSSR